MTNPQAPATAEGPTQHTQNQVDAARAALFKLREPFPPAETRYRPQPWCKACSEAPRKVCQRHTEIKCQRCQQKLTEAHICLKFIGHAEVTNRLLNVDPFWQWEPLAYDERGLPQYDGNTGLWIRLTVCGVTRIGYGDATGKKGANAVKEIIGDAIRNAGMRFGMALNLWTKSDLELIEPGVEMPAELAEQIGGGFPDTEQNQPPASRPAPAAATPAAPGPAEGRSAEQAPPAGESPDPVADAVLAKFYEQAKEQWKLPNVLTQIKEGARQKGVLGMEVPGMAPERKPMPFEHFLDALIARATAANRERNAA